MHDIVLEKQGAFGEGLRRSHKIRGWCGLTVAEVRFLERKETKTEVRKEESTATMAAGEDSW